MSMKCGGCRRVVKQGNSCNDCGVRFHPKCCYMEAENALHSPWSCSTCKSSKEKRELESRISCLESTLAELTEELNVLKAEKAALNVKELEWITAKTGGKHQDLHSTNFQLEVSNAFGVLENLTEDVSDTTVGLSHCNKVVKKHTLCKARKKKSKKVLLLGSSHGRGLSAMLQSSLGSDVEVCSIFKPNAELGNVVDEISNLGKDLTKEDHIIIVGGPGNSLSRNLNYCVETDIDNIAKNTTHTNVGFVDLFKRYDQPWMRGHVQRTQADLKRALCQADRTHIGLIDVSGITRSDHTSHGLHLNVRGKQRLTQMIASSIRRGRLDVNPIPVVIGGRTQSFLGQISRVGSVI